VGSFADSIVDGCTDCNVEMLMDKLEFEVTGNKLSTGLFELVSMYTALNPRTIGLYRISTQQLQFQLFRKIVKVFLSGHILLVNYYKYKEEVKKTDYGPFIEALKFRSNESLTLIENSFWPEYEKSDPSYYLNEPLNHEKEKTYTYFNHNPTSPVKYLCNVSALSNVQNHEYVLNLNIFYLLILCIISPPFFSESSLVCASKKSMR
jgi:hypothetical protein